MNMIAIHMHGFGRGAMSCVEEGKAETSMGSRGEPEEMCRGNHCNIIAGSKKITVIATCVPWSVA